MSNTSGPRNLGAIQSIGNLAKSHRGVLFCYLALGLYGTVVFVSLRDFVPFYDGWSFYKRCFIRAAETGRFWYPCYGHLSHFPTAVYGSIAWLFPYNYMAMALFNLAIGLAACYALGRSLGHLFSDRKLFRHILVAAIVLNPVMIAQMVQPSLDYMLAVLTIFVLAAFIANETLIAFLIGCLMTVTKEPGIMIYGLLWVGYSAAMLINTARAKGFRGAMMYAISHSYMVLPLFFFLAYANDLGVHTGSFRQPNMSFGDIIQMLVSFQVDRSLCIAQMASLFILNFNWILTLPIMAGAGVLFYRRKLLSTAVGQWLAILLVALAGSAFFHTRVLAYNCPRYVLPIVVILITAASVAVLQLSSLSFSRLFGILVSVYLLLLTCSQFYTLDPISKLVFGTFRFGTYEMLNMYRLRVFGTNEPPPYFGRDQLVYNLQFVQLSELAELAVGRLGFNRLYITGPRFAAQDDFCFYHPATGERSMRPDARYVMLTPFDRLSTDFLGGGGEAFVYLEFPNVLNEEPLKLLKERYKLLAKHTMSNGGYSIHAYEFAPL